MSDPALSTTIFVRRLQVRGFRSLADCEVRFEPLTVLVGFNASGKSNVLDALSFVVHALLTSPERAVAARGGLDSLLHRSHGVRATSFSISLELGLKVSAGGDDRSPATYSLEIGRSGQALVVLNETCSVFASSGDEHGFTSDTNDKVLSRLRLPLIAVDDPLLSALETALLAMQFYDLDTGTLRALDESPDESIALGSAGEHLGRVLADLEAQRPSDKERLDGYLSALVPDAVGIDERREGRYSTIEARFRTRSDAPPVGLADVEVFPRESLSEGTLRAAGVLAALLQTSAHEGAISLIGMEEPETALHPANVGALYEALDDAAAHTQVIVTSQSSALLDSEYVNIDHLRVVESIDGATVVGEIDAAGREIVDKGLMTISQLHASGQMRPASVSSGSLG